MKILSVKIILYPLLASIFWGMSFVWTSIVFDDYSPITTIFIRLVISSTFLLLYLKSRGRKIKIHTKDWGLFFIISLFNPFLYFLFENFGLLHTTPTVSSVIIALIPVLTPVFAWLMIREKVSILNILGICISFTGILIMLLRKDLQFDSSLLGIALLFGAVISALIYAVLVKKVVKKYSPVEIVTYQNLIGMILFLPLFFIFDFNSFIQVIPDFRLIGSLFALSIFSSSLAFIFFTYSIREIGLTRTNIYSNLIPVVTAIASFFILHEQFVFQKIIGIIVVIIGIFISQIKKPVFLYNLFNIKKTEIENR